MGEALSAATREVAFRVMPRRHHRNTAANARGPHDGFRFGAFPSLLRCLLLRVRRAALAACKGNCWLSACSSVVGSTTLFADLCFQLFLERGLPGHVRGRTTVQGFP